MVLFLGFGPSFVNLGVHVFLIGTLINIRRGASSQWSASILLGGALPLSGSCPLGWETALATVTTSPNFQGCVFFISLVYLLF